MANAGADVTGLKELAAAIDRLPETVTVALRDVAASTARRIQERAKRLAPRSEGLRSRLNTGNPRLADSIEIVDDVAHKQYQVEPNTPWNPNLGLWLERGTVKMQARPFMRPAGDAEDARYKADSLREAEKAINVLGTL